MELTSYFNVLSVSSQWREGKMRQVTFAALLFVVVLLPTGQANAQVTKKELVFSEIHLDDTNPEQSWIEVHNPTNKPLILERFRYSHVRTLNMLPEEIQRQGGLSIAPGECIVLSGEGANNGGYLVKDISRFSGGGTLSIKTKGLKEGGGDIVRYGNFSNSAHAKTLSDKPIVGFSHGSESYSREDGGFVASEATPGKHAGNGQ